MCDERPRCVSRCGETLSIKRDYVTSEPSKGVVHSVRVSSRTLRLLAFNAVSHWLCAFRFRMPYKQWHEDLDQIKRRCRGGDLFEDPEFPAIDSKVFKKRVLPGGQSFEWLRPQVRAWRADFVAILRFYVGAGEIKLLFVSSVSFED